MIRRQVGICLVLIFGTLGSLKAQDPEFSQFYANPLYLNPALTGTVKCPRATLNYRNQWPALGKTYVTYSASYDQFVRILEGSVGILLYQDVQGDGAINTTNISGMYSYTFQINRNFYINGALQATYIQKKLNMEFIFPDMLHPLYGPIYPTSEVLVPTDNSKGHFDLSTGLIGYNRNYFFGLAVHHLTEPTESWRGNDDAVLPRKFTLHFGTNIPIGNKKDNISISPNLLFQQQQDFQQMNWGLYLNRKGIVFGAWFRQNLTFNYDSFILLLGYVQDKMKFAYSYDITTSQLRNQTLGAHEVSFTMTFPCKQRKAKFRTISCPSF